MLLFAMGLKRPKEEAMPSGALKLPEQVLHRLSSLSTECAHEKCITWNVTRVCGTNANCCSRCIQKAESKGIWGSDDINAANKYECYHAIAIQNAIQNEADANAAHKADCAAVSIAYTSWNYYMLISTCIVHLAHGGADIAVWHPFSFMASSATWTLW